MTNKKTSAFFFVAASIFLLVTKLAVALYYNNAGLDIGDEGQATMGYRYASDYLTFPYYQLAHAVLGNAVGDFIVSRILKLIVELLSVLFLSASLYLWVVSVFPEKTGFKNFILLFSAASLSCCSFLFGRIIMYDDFTLFIPALCFFVLSYNWFRKADSLPATISSYCMAGILTGLLIFIKPTAPFFLFCGIALLTFFQFNGNRKIIFISLVSLILSTVIGVLCGIQLIGGWPVMKADLQQIIFMSPFWHYNAETMLMNYWHRDTKYLALLLVSTFIFFVSLKKGSPPFSWIYATAFTWIAAIFIFYTDNNSVPVRYQHAMLWLLISSTSGLSILILRHFRFMSFNFLLPLLLIAFPYTSAFGTANSVFENSCFYYSINYLLAFIAVYFFLPPDFFKCWAYYLFISAGMWVVIQVAFPFGLSTNLFVQKQAAVDADNRLSTDSQSAVFLNSLYHELLQNEFKPGDEIIVTDGMTGIATLMQGRMPGMPSLINNAPEFNRHVLEKSDTIRKFPYVVSFSNKETAIHLYFKNSKIDLAAKYHVAYVLPNTYKKTIHEYYGAETSDSVYLYVPIKN